jgi:hypothetical protein
MMMRFLSGHEPMLPVVNRWGNGIVFSMRKGFKVQGSGFRVQGSGFWVLGSGFRVQGSRFWVQGS